MTVQRQAIWYSVVMVFLSLGVAVAISILYAQRVASDNEHKWCKIVSTLDTAYRTQPPTTATGKQLAKDMHQLLKDLHCSKESTK